MDWSEVKIKVSTKDGETAAAVAQMTVPYGIYIEDYSDIETEVPRIANIDLIDEELLARDRTVTTIHIYIKPTENPAEAVSFITQRLEQENIPCETEIVNVKEEDWATAWKKYYHPVRVGKHLVVCPTWEEYEHQEGDITLSLDPGMAFGTGTHDTTRLCMELLEEYIKPEHRMLDIGTGSGILSIAGALLGAKSALGVDIDDTAVRVAKENARVNHVEDKTTFVCGDLAAQADGKYNIITANIVADVIIRLVPDIPELLAEDGIFIVSGIIDERKDDVVQAFEEHSFMPIALKESGGWAAIASKYTK